MKSDTKRFTNFIHSFGAARVLLQRANKQGSLIEGLALYTSLVDGFLRIALVLKRQLKHRISDIDQTLISQEPNGRFFTERQIQRMAYEEGIIAESVFKELNVLYDKRNDTIHKFFLTSIKYQDLPNVLERYEIVYKHLYKVVYALEAEQVKSGVGMTRAGSRQVDEAIITEIMKKIG